MNSAAGTYGYDMGRDGKPGTAHQFTARDAYSFTLNYFDNDYKPVNATENPFPSVGATQLSTAYRPLYNGNISSMATYIRMYEGDANKIDPYLLQNYTYDQLNRLTAMDVYTGYNTIANSWSALTATDKFRERVSYDGNGNIQTYQRAGSGYPSLFDDMTYHYTPGTNRLRHVKDQVAATAFGNNSWDIIRDIDDQPDDNYAYDAIGNLVKDSSENITSIRWNVYGKIVEINRNPAAGSFNNTTQIRYTYDAQGNRISKVVSNRDNDIKQYTWYVRDAQGNILNTYTAAGNATNLSDLEIQLKERYLFGSSRLGMHFTEMGVKDGPADMEYYSGTDLFRGLRQYELSNHLGNVLTTISDKKNGVASAADGSLTDYFNPDIISAQDYYPFGMTMRVQLSENGRNYRFGFNGKENDNEVKGWGNEQDYGMRIYDPRLGRFLSVDPITSQYPELTPYQYASNSPLQNIDIDGLEGGWYLNKTRDDLADQSKHAKTSQQVEREMRLNALFRLIKQPPVLLSQWDKPRNEFEQERQQAFNTRIWQSYGYNADGSKAGWMKLADNKHFKAFADNVALPMIEGYMWLDGIAELRELAIGTKTLLSFPTPGGKIKYIREALNLKGRNIAIVEGQINNTKILDVAISGEKSGTFTSEKIAETRIFETYSVNFPRAFDSEAKLLETIAEKYKATPNVSGTITLTSELPYCGSCTDVIKQFKAKFPNIRVNQVNGASYDKPIFKQ